MSDEPQSSQTQQISFNDFLKVKLRVGRVIEASELVKAASRKSNSLASIQ